MRAILLVLSIAVCFCYAQLGGMNVATRTAVGSGSVLASCVNPIDGSTYWMTSTNMYKVAADSSGLPDVSPTLVMSYPSTSFVGCAISGLPADKPTLFVANNKAAYKYSLTSTLPTSLGSAWKTVTVGFSPDDYYSVIWTSSGGSSGTGSVWITTRHSISKFTYSGSDWVEAGSFKVPVEVTCCPLALHTDYAMSRGLLFYDGFVYVGSTRGSLFRIPVASSGTFSNKEELSGVLATTSITTLVATKLAGAPCFFMGAEQGVVGLYRVSDGVTLQLALISGNLPVVAVVADDEFEVGYFTTMAVGATPGKVGRINFSALGQLATIDELVAPASAGFGALRIAPQKNYLVAGSTNGGLQRVTMSNCGAFACSVCGVTDQRYCGYCADTGECMLPGNREGGCTSNLRTAPPVCPSISTMVSPADPRGSKDGGSAVILSGTNLYSAGGAASFECRIGASKVAATQVAPTSISCKTPPGTAGSATLSVLFKGIQIQGSVPWTFYDCGAQSCGQCSDSQFGECSWSYRSASCQTSSKIAGAKGTACPVLTNVLPSAAPIAGDTPVTLSVSYLAPGETYRCRFGTIIKPSTSVSEGASGTVTCNSPASALAVASAKPDLLIGTGEVVYTTVAHTKTFEIYDCLSIDPCYTCLSNHPACQICPGESHKCQYKSTSCAAGTENIGTCPTVSGYTPSSFHNSEVSTNFYLNASVAITGTTIQCAWYSPALVYEYTSATVTAGTQATCKTPATLAVGTWTVSIRIDNILFTNPIPIPIYDCSNPAPNGCVSCLSSAARPKCLWCDSTLSCNLQSAFGSCSSVISSSNTCPTVKALPDTDTIFGGRTIQLTPSVPVPVPSPTSVQCDFSGVGKVAAVQVDQAYNCTAPAANTIITTTVSLAINSVNYGPPVPFTYFTCDLASSCAQCTGLQGCGWCGGACRSSSNCTIGATTTCPTLLSVTPNFAEANTPSYVRVKTNLPLHVSVLYECVFNGDSQPSIANIVGVDEVECATPKAFAGVGSVQVNVVGVGRLTDSPLPFEFYSCPTTLAKCNELCSSVKYCGWCFDSGSCTGKQYCGLDVENPLWSNSSCAAITGIQPQSVQVSRVNQTATTQQIMVHMDPTFPVPNDGLKKRALADWDCSFDTEFTQPVSSIDYTTNTFTFTSDSTQFQVVDCEAIPVCGLCILSPYCGWCPGSIKCSTKEICALEPIPSWNATCPTLDSLVPQVADVAGGIPITIQGNLFVPADEYTVSVDGSTDLVPATWISQTELSFIAPPSINGEVKSASVVVYFNGSIYAGDEVTYLNYIPNSGVQAAVIAPTVSIALVVIIALAVALIIMKTRKIGFFYEFTLKEPDYLVVAFGSLLDLQYKMPKDNYDILSQHLLKDPHFIYMVIMITQSTEEDPVAKTLCNLWEKYDKSVENMVLTINFEIFRTEFENTIFRNNSVASRMFKFYSKVTGIKYLFHNLARFIVELNGLSARKAKGDARASKSLLSMEMEVDPDKFGGAESGFVDSEANLYQLILACQKVFSSVRESTAEIPVQWKEIFRSLKDGVYYKFKSENAVFKAVGGFLFLRFICPAITAPHAYGLLENPPNTVCQRQLVLIGKVIQSLANMQLPGVKEVFMQQLNDFFVRNIPKMRQFYIDLLNAETFGIAPTRVIDVPDAVNQNGLAWMYGHLLTNKTKIATVVPENFAPQEAHNLQASVDEVFQTYGDKIPKKLTKGDVKESKAKESK